ncbi:Methanogenic corrinoid protein MtbC1 [Cognatiyoonia koreensis]|uniref:Methanogenic corrinoid protein MtbC1 n=1 Tax=Cognatiyoonia koreensis TaxID=364200 RepID=A0A1I0RQS5_9RHOB|nr:cobalamin B12-binding domain-containing protein [Cognatiyoonia koreensis]SEW43665.1 Methanogenic corrinoid protein MtbC1 [Cognatiyoonia koreensis]
MDDYRNADKSFTSLDLSGDDGPLSPLDKLPKPGCDDSLVAFLKAAALTPSAQQCRDAMALAQMSGVSPEQLCEHFIPIVARELGAGWCEDALSFADVTIGTARLQSMLRDLQRVSFESRTPEPNASTVLLVVPENTHHTLGAMVLSGQLRRNGLSVRLMLGATPDDVKYACDNSAFDAVFVSAVRGESLETLRRMVESVRSSTSASTIPVVVGGTLLELQPDIAALTGADYVTSIAEEAITLCNLKTKPIPANMMGQ